MHRRVPMIRAAVEGTSVATSIVAATHDRTTTKKQPFQCAIRHPPLQYSAKHVSRDGIGATVPSAGVAWRAPNCGRRLCQVPPRTRASMTERAQPTDLELAALISSKICHDVIGPVGAIYNGLEILDEDDDAQA